MEIHSKGECISVASIDLIRDDHCEIFAKAIRGPGSEGAILRLESLHLLPGKKAK